MPFEKPFTEDILDSIGEGLFTVDKNFKINFFNRAAERITGLKREEVIGRFCKNVFKSTLCMQQCPIGRVLETGQALYDRNATIRHKNGMTIPIRLNAAVLRNRQDQPEGGVISFRDLSDVERLHEKLKEKGMFQGMVGYSKPMQEIFRLIEEISDSDASVLIQGESGTGKEMVADAIQALSLRKDKPYVKINCSVFPPQLLASELFGHVRGAFTGAIRDRLGRFELANHGTLFLDEVAEMPLQMQLQLLRVLQEGTFERVGESVTRKVDVRIIAATNLNINQAISRGQFRKDLYYRLNVIPITLPPLRERREDIPHLVRFFVQKFAYICKKDIRDLEPEAMDYLMRYPWPGNIRELENALEYAFARTRGVVIRPESLPPAIHQYFQKVTQSNPYSAVPGAAEESEYQRILRLLETYHWNRARVARELGVGRTTLWRKMKNLGIAPD